MTTPPIRSEAFSLTPRVSESVVIGLPDTQPRSAVYDIPGEADVSLRALRRIAVPSYDNGWYSTVTMGGLIENVGVLTAAYESEEGNSASTTSDEATSVPLSNLFRGYVSTSESNVPDGLVRININFEPPNILQNLLDVPDGFGDTFIPTTIVWRIRKLRRQVWIMTVHGAVIGRNLSEDYNNRDTTRIEVVKGVVEPEDRGSWVIDATTKAFLGIVIHISNSEATICTAKTIWNTTLMPQRLEEPHLISRRENEDPGVDLIYASAFLPTWKPPDTLFPSTHDNQTASRSPRHLFLHCIKHLFREHPSKSSESGIRYLTGTEAEVGRVGNETLWPLPNEVEREWRRLEPQVRSIIWQTPPLSQYKPSSPVVFHVYLMGTEAGNATPKVIIGCRSREYAKRLKSQIKKSQLLKMERYEVIVPRKDIKWGTNHNTPITPGTIEMG